MKKIIHASLLFLDAPPLFFDDEFDGIKDACDESYDDASTEQNDASDSLILIA